MKHVLIPTDFSENAWNATLYARALFKNEECTFYLLNVYTPAISSSRFLAASSDAGVSQDAAHFHSERGLRALLERIGKTDDNPAHSYKTISSFSLLVDEIKKTIENQGIDFIVTGMKGVSGEENVFMGSHTVRMIKSIKNCPILVVPRHFDFVAPSEIAFATDFNRFYSQPELQPLIDMANSFDAVIRIVHVQYEIKALTELQRFNLGMLRRYLKNVGHYVHTISQLNSVSNTLERFTKGLDIHLLAMLNYPHSYMERITREPIVKRVAFQTSIPLLVIPELGLGLSTKRSIKRKNMISY